MGGGGNPCYFVSGVSLNHNIMPSPAIMQHPVFMQESPAFMHYVDCTYHANFHFVVAILQHA